jgi:hypothetical protein
MTINILTLCHYAECHCAECRYSVIVMLNVNMLNVIMPNVIILNVIMLNAIMPNVNILSVVMLSVVAPLSTQSYNALFFYQYVTTLENGELVSRGGDITIARSFTASGMTLVSQNGFVKGSLHGRFQIALNQTHKTHFVTGRVNGP